MAAAVEAGIIAAGGSLSTTLEVLASGLRIGVDEVRRVVLELEYIAFVEADRHGIVVSVDEFAAYALAAARTSRRSSMSKL